MPFFCLIGNDIFFNNLMYLARVTEQEVSVIPVVFSILSCARAREV